MGKVIDIEAEEGPLRSGLRGRRAARRARTGQQPEKPMSRVFWISFGAVVTVVTLRLFERYVPRQPQGALPPPPPPEAF